MNDLTLRLKNARLDAPGSITPGVLLDTGLADALITVDGPVGPLHVAFNHHGVSGTSLLEDRAAYASTFEARIGRPLIPVTSAPAPLARRLERAVNQGRLGSLPLDLRSVSGFRRRVLEFVTATIPPGQVRPYGWVARELGQPGSARAVGTAMATNPIPVLVPCHRVVRSDGDLGNYLFGTDTKAALLAREGMDVDGHRRAVVEGRRLVGSATTSIVCFDTCSHARRIGERHRRWFRNPGAATAAGFRPCAVCRPFVSDG